MALNLFKIETAEVSSNASSVTFSSIPQGYTDLIVKFSTRETDAGSFGHFGIIFNSDTGANYASQNFRADGASNSSSFSTGSNYISASYGNAAGSTANTFGIGEVYIPNYTGSNQKSVTMESANETNSATAYMFLTAGLWTSTAAITSITFKQTITGIFVANSTFTLYGIL